MAGASRPRGCSTRPARRPAAAEHAAGPLRRASDEADGHALSRELASTLREADMVLALRLAFEQLAERTRVAMLKPQLVAALDRPLNWADVDELRAELAEIEGLRHTLRRLAA